ncbi:hypothetical protein Tco_0926707 [Tanacetum coccineum]|uniref:Uncharacterized protein n=1 Tax=Tanacetum coccineum TaxID=301880 RepID=A0ABQ5DCI8_9ASTR
MCLFGGFPWTDLPHRMNPLRWYAIPAISVPSCMPMLNLLTMFLSSNVTMQPYVEARYLELEDISAFQAFLDLLMLESITWHAQKENTQLRSKFAGLAYLYAKVFSFGIVRNVVLKDCSFFSPCARLVGVSSKSIPK